ncbi:unnamed protein product [Bursaphelenchus okinawaensis]|uniref:Uncharacterized protein n=1 Tax=Bursaphelenchus okinawaensis TaxID=465554 RepID=A0A811K1T3_9BILA|nr:unnamed protein product [Bursaphelenchus okinawaensis]CAG9089157.1 unnamed protein product [Bursaphelenchus okinawaensis]
MAVRDTSAALTLLIRICLYFVFLMLCASMSVYHTYYLTDANRIFMVVPLQVGESLAASVGYVLLRKILLSTYKNIRFAGLSKQFQKNQQ